MLRRQLWYSIVLCWGIIGAPFAVALAAAQEPEYDIDIIASTNLAVTKEHTAAFIRGLVSEVDDCYVGLKVRTYESDEKPKDGAARFRLALEHRGTVAIGNSLTSRGGFPKSDIKSFVNGKRLDIVVGTDFKYHQTIWLIAASQKGTIGLKFQKWDGSAYKTLDSWSVPSPDCSDLAESKGLLIVADLVQDGTKAKIDLKPKAPKTLEQAKNEALMRVLPGEFSNSIYAHFAKGTIQKLKGGEGTAEVEFMIENKSPWPLVSARVDAFAKGVVLGGDLNFKPPIRPGKSSLAKITVIPETPDVKRLPGVRLANLNFEHEMKR
jgi:hypothetical protein